MASTTKAPKAKSTTGESAKPIVPKAWPYERPENQQHRQFLPKVGEPVFLHLNDRPFWEPPSWGPLVFATVQSIRDLAEDPLTAAELAEFATANIGRYLVHCTWANSYESDEDVGQCYFFWNDCLLHCYWESSQEDPVDQKHGIEIPSESPSQPYHRSALQIVYRDMSTIPLGHVFESSLEERLKLIGKLGQLRNEAEGDPLDNLRVRPEPLT